MHAVENGSSSKSLEMRKHVHKLIENKYSVHGSIDWYSVERLFKLRLGMEPSHIRHEIKYV